MPKGKPRPKPPAAKRFPPRRPPKKLVALGHKLLAPCLALVVVIVSAAAGTGDRDYVLLIEGQDPICAKSGADCVAAQAAILAGRWDAGVPRDTPTSCRPSPSCFSARSNCIVGYSC